MNKKFFTLLAAAGMATAVNAQTIYYGTDGKAKYQGGDLSNQPVDARFPWTPFMGTIDLQNSQSPISKLEKVGDVENNLFQLVLTAQGGDSYALAMQWDKTAQKYQLVGVNTKNNDTNKSFVDETLWEVKSVYVGNSKDLRYVLVNKAAQLPLQVNPAGNDNAVNLPNGTKKWNPTYVEGDVITWSWSNVADTKDATTPLSGVLSAAINSNQSVYISGIVEYGSNAEDIAGDGIVKISVIGNDKVPTDDHLKFKAYKATHIALSAAQINSMMTGAASQAPVKFSMNPEIAGSEYGNALTDGKFTAWEEATATNNDLYQIKDLGVEDGYVYLAADKDRKNLLRVDTVYHNSAKDARYELRLTTEEAVAPREAYVIEEDYQVKPGALTGAVVAAMKKQAQFRFEYNPSEQSVMIQALQYMYLDKDAKASWWKALYLANLATPATDFTATNLPKQADGTSTAARPTGETDYLVDATNAVVTKVESVTITPAEDETEVDMITPAFKDASSSNGYILSKVNDAGEWYNNLIKLTTLTTSPKHSEVTVGYDSRDAKYHGINTLIQLGAYAQKEAAYIDGGYYYVQNGNKVTRELMPSNYYRYHDLAATNATQTAFDDDKNAWVVKGNLQELGADKDYVETPNIVFSEEKLEAIPSAQWYFSGAAGFYTITNRESKISTSQVYLWKVKDAAGNVVADTYACKGFGATSDVNDTIVISKVPAMDLHMGYLNLSAEEAAKETAVFNFQYATLGNDPLNVTFNAGNEMLVSAEDGKMFKLERVQLTDKDEYTGKDVKYPIDLRYGFSYTKADTLNRAMYYIYEHNVSSETTEPTGKKTRNYVTIDGGKFVMSESVVNVAADGFTTYSKDDNSGRADNRKKFYIKNISNVANEFVLIDPETTSTADGAYKGIRAFVNQQSGILQPAGLKSQGASNVYDNSVFTFNQVTRYNYRQIATAPDTVIFHKAGNERIKLYETSAKGAAVSLLGRDNHDQFNRNFAFFIDTVDTNPEKPTFLIGLRNASYGETGSNIPGHNEHWWTVADYLTVMTDSAKVNAAYKDVYGNVRLGFMYAIHESNNNFALLKEGANPEAGKLLESDIVKEYDLMKEACPSVFSFRYVDANSDDFYIETTDGNGKTVWIKTINEVPVIVNTIKEAEVFNVAQTEEAPTSNEAVEATEVSIVAENGAVVVKNAAGKTVTVNTILGKTIANEVVASDNETIAVPAGVVAVSVDGAEAVKVLVK